MNAIIDNGTTYQITGERGDFHICEDNRGKVKMFAKRDVEVVEIDAMPKAKTYRKPSKSYTTRPIDVLKRRVTAMVGEGSVNEIRTKFSEAAELTDIVKSILNQAITKGSISDKQVYVLAKFAEENHVSL